MISHIGWTRMRQVNPLLGQYCLAALLAMAWAANTMAQSADMTQQVNANSPGAQTNWPQLGYNNAHTGLNPFEKVLSPSTVGRLKELWAFTTSGNVGGPAVVNGIVYFGSSDSHVYAVHASNGALVWNTLLGDGGGNMVPSVVNGMVYLGTGIDHGHLYALNAATGAIVWKFHPGAGVNSSPTVANGKVYIAANDSKVYALNASTGAMVWTFTADASFICSPSVANGKVYVASTGGTTYALNATTGAMVWRFPNPTNSIFSPSLAVAKGKVYVGENDGNIYALDASTGAVVWSDFISFGGLEVVAAPAVANGVVYIGANDGSFWALDAITGAKVWENPQSSEIFVNSAVANGVVYAVGQSQVLHILDAVNGKVLNTLTLGGPIYYSSPAVVNGSVYVGSFDKKLHAYGLTQ
jgi:outer membrane protein assembly factor BamB